MKTLIKAAICIIIALLFFLTTPPAGLEANAWHFLGIFIAVIIAIILQVAKLELICIIAIAIVALSSITVPKKDADLKVITTLKNMSKKYPEIKVNDILTKSRVQSLQSLTSSVSTDELFLQKEAFKLKGKLFTNESLRLAQINALKQALTAKIPLAKINAKVNKVLLKYKSKQSIKNALSAFSNGLIWLITASIMVARGIVKTGLGERMAYYFIRLFGKKSLGVGYSVVLSELILAPITPSNTARAGGIINPIVQSISRGFNSSPEEGTQGKIGTFLSLINYHANPISSAMFITATAPNPLVVDLIAKATHMNIQLSWGTWALGMLLPGLGAMIVMPLIIYLFAKPQITSTPQAAVMAKEKLASLGKMSLNEKLMLGIFIILLALWSGLGDLIFGVKFNSTAVAFLGLALSLVSGVLSTKDILAEKQAWSTMLWFSALVMMANMLTKLGVSAYLTHELSDIATMLHLGKYTIMFFLAAAFLYAHYLFASTTAHISAMFFVFYSTGLFFGAPPMLFAFIMLSAGNIMMCLTHYATGTSPVIFSSGFITLKKWWQIGFIMSIVNVVVIIGIGLIWWKFLGFY